jgi:hypothetical protein
MTALILMFALPAVASTVLCAGAVELIRSLPEAGEKKKGRRGRGRRRARR